MENDEFLKVLSEQVGFKHCKVFGIFGIQVGFIWTSGI